MSDETVTREKILKDYPRMGLDERFTFECRPGLSCFTCCCQDVSIVLTPYDILRLKRALRMDSSEFLEKHTITRCGEQPELPRGPAEDAGRRQALSPRGRAGVHRLSEQAVGLPHVPARRRRAAEPQPRRAVLPLPAQGRHLQGPRPGTGLDRARVDLGPGHRGVRHDGLLLQGAHAPSRLGQGRGPFRRASWTWCTWRVTTWTGSGASSSRRSSWITSRWTRPGWR